MSRDHIIEYLDGLISDPDRLQAVEKIERKAKELMRHELVDDDLMMCSLKIVEDNLRYGIRRHLGLPTDTPTEGGLSTEFNKFIEGLKNGNSQEAVIRAHTYASIFVGLFLATADDLVKNLSQLKDMRDAAEVYATARNLAKTLKEPSNV